MTSCRSKEPNSPRFNHVALQVSNMEKSIKFYTSAFGLEVTKRITQLERTDQDGNTTNFDINLTFLKFPEEDFVYELSQSSEMDSLVQSPLLKHIGIDVNDIEKAYLKAINLGAKSITSIRSVKANDLEVKQAFISGIDGEVIELIQVISGEF